MYLVYTTPPPQILHNHCFQFLLGITVVSTDIEDYGYAIFFFEGGGGVNKVHCGVCENGEFRERLSDKMHATIPKGIVGEK